MTQGYVHIPAGHCVDGCRLIWGRAELRCMAHLVFSSNYLHCPYGAV